MKYYISPAPMNPVSRLLTTLVAALSLIGFFIFGLVVVGIVLALLLAFGAVVWLRSKWLGRASAASPAHQRPDDAIDAEYTVVHRRRE